MASSSSFNIIRSLSTRLLRSSTVVRSSCYYPCITSKQLQVMNKRCYHGAIVKPFLGKKDKKKAAPKTLVPFPQRVSNFINGNSSLIWSLIVFTITLTFSKREQKHHLFADDIAREFDTIDSLLKQYSGFLSDNEEKPKIVRQLRARLLALNEGKGDPKTSDLSMIALTGDQFMAEFEEVLKDFFNDINKQFSKAREYEIQLAQMQNDEDVKKQTDVVLY